MRIHTPTHAYCLQKVFPTKTVKLLHNGRRHDKVWRCHTDMNISEKKRHGLRLIPCTASSVSFSLFKIEIICIVYKRHEYKDNRYILKLNTFQNIDQQKSFFIHFGMLAIYLASAKSYVRPTFMKIEDLQKSCGGRVRGADIRGKENKSSGGGGKNGEKVSPPPPPLSVMKQLH